MANGLIIKSQLEVAIFFCLNLHKKFIAKEIIGNLDSVGDMF